MKKNKKEFNVKEEHDKLMKTISDVENAKKKQKYFTMKYPLIDDIEKDIELENFDVVVSGVKLKHKFIKKPKHIKVSFIQKLRYIIDVILGRTYPVYYFEDIQKRHKKYVAAYLDFKKPL